MLNNYSLKDLKLQIPCYIKNEKGIYLSYSFRRFNKYIDLIALYPPQYILILKEKEIKIGKT